MEEPLTGVIIWEELTVDLARVMVHMAVVVLLLEVVMETTMTQAWEVATVEVVVVLVPFMEVVEEGTMMQGVVDIIPMDDKLLAAL